MKLFVFACLALPCLPLISLAQRRIEPAACPVAVDSSFQTRCGYLIVPENRKKNNGKIIKLPFIVVRSRNPDKKKDPLLFMGGGPGVSSLGWVQGATQHTFINDRDCIAFEQRGAFYALPRLQADDLDAAIRESYRKNLNKDSMAAVGVKKTRKVLEAKGIDLAAYNTDETVSDIHDLLQSLAIDSVNLFGISYSGGLMLAVLQRYPDKVRSLILNSPLPNFVPIDQDEPANLMEALQVLFNHCEKDSTDKNRYGNLNEKFREYFNSISGRVFHLRYLEKGAADSADIEYGRNELLTIVNNSMGDYTRLKDVPFLVAELIRGNHHDYIKRFLDDLFLNNQAPSAMRLSVYCGDQAAYNDQRVVRQISNAYPFMEGYHINDVYKSLCDCWPTIPVDPQTKKPFYSSRPALLFDGEMDNACRPLYIDMIHHYMPNSQRLLFTDRTHGVWGNEINQFIDLFLKDPFRKLSSENKKIISY